MGVTLISRAYDSVSYRLSAKARARIDARHLEARQQREREGAELVKKDGFWFVDIPRTSSSSIRGELGVKFGATHGKTNRMNKDYATEQIFRPHIPALEMRDIIGDQAWGELFTFSIVRNPWARMASLYHYRKKHELADVECSFREYIHRLVEADETTKLFRYHGYRLGAADYVTDRDGRKIIVDEIVKIEDRGPALREIGQRIGLCGLGSLEIQRASPRGLCYRELYDDTTRDLIGERYARDVELFGYSF